MSRPRLSCRTPTHPKDKRKRKIKKGAPNNPYTSPLATGAEGAIFAAVRLSTSS